MISDLLKLERMPLKTRTWFCSK